MTTQNTQTDDGRTVRDIRQSGDDVRYVSNPDGSLVAYRDGDEHVVLSRGNEPRTRWTERVPAERTAVVEGEQLWAIPENWEHRAQIDGAGERYYGIYHIPETGVDVLVTRPVNCHLVDKWFGVKQVGELTAEYDDEWDWAAVERAAEYDAVDDTTAEHLRTLVARQDRVERTMAERINQFADEAALEPQYDDYPISYDGWEWDAWGDTVTEEGELVAADVLGIEGQELNGVLTELEHEKAIPHYPTLRIDVVEADLPEDYHLRALAEAGLSGAEAMDYLGVEIHGHSQTEWADRRGIDQSSVSKNVSQAERKLQA